MMNFKESQLKNLFYVTASCLHNIELDIVNMKHTRNLYLKGSAWYQHYDNQLKYLNYVRKRVQHMLDTYHSI